MPWVSFAAVTCGLSACLGFLLCVKFSLLAFGAQRQQLGPNLEFANNRGSLELSVSYPVSPRYEVVLQYFNGYGDSLIDYDRRQNRIGLGFQLAAF